MSEEASKIPDETLSDIEAIRDTIRVEQEQSRRVMLWFITVFIFILLLVLALFMVAGVYVMRSSRQVTAAVEKVDARATVNEFNISNFTNQFADIRNAQLKITAKLNSSGSNLSREIGKLSVEQRRHSKWIEVKDSAYERDKRNLSNRLLELSKDIAENSRALEKLSKKVDKFVTVGSVVVVPGNKDTEGKTDKQDTGKKKDNKKLEDDTISADAVEKMFADALKSVVVPTNNTVKPESISVVTFPNGDRYEGEFKNGLMDGWGIYTYKDGSRYEGHFKNDFKEGTGTLTTADGQRYVGEFTNGIKNGKGSLTREDGMRYVGDFVNDLISGTGVMFYPNGDKYAGEFLNAIPNGHGVMRFSNGDIYDGDFRNGVRTGHGKYLFANGMRYIGDFVDGVRQGMGRYIYTDGSEYIGPFVDGKKHGEGVRVYPNGIRRKGLWRDDKFIHDIQE